MKITAQIAVIGALLAVGIAQSNAQSNAVVVSQVNISLTGFEGDETTAHAVKIATKDVINAIAAADGTSFSKTAKLMIVAPAEGGDIGFIVRETSGKTFTDTDVSSFFTPDSSDVVSNGKVQYEIFHLQFSDGAGTSFDVSGFATDKIGKVNGRDTGVLTDQVTSFTASVSGTGSVAGTFAVFKGTVSANGAKGELQ